MTFRYRSVLVVVLLAASVLVPLGGLGARPVPSLPSDMPAKDRSKVQDVRDSAAVSAHAELEPFSGRSGVFEYLLDHPEFAAHVARTLRLARYRIWSTPEGLALDDGWGVTGHFELVYAGSGTRIMSARGQYHHGLLPDIRGQAVVVLDYRIDRLGDGRDLVRTAVTGFVKVDNGLLAFAAKLAGPAAAEKANLEARRLLRVFARVSRAIEESPQSVYAKLHEKPDVPQRELEEFGRLLNLPAGPAP